MDWIQASYGRQVNFKTMLYRDPAQHPYYTYHMRKMHGAWEFERWPEWQRVMIPQAEMERLFEQYNEAMMERYLLGAT